MGIRFYCPNGHKLHVKAFQAGMRGICPYCGAKVQIPLHSTRPSTKELKAQRAAQRRAMQSPSRSKAPSFPSDQQISDQTSAPPQTVSAPTTPFENLTDFLEPTPAENAPEPLGGFRAMPTPLDASLGGVSESAASSDAVPRSQPVPPPVMPQQSVEDPLSEPDAAWYVRPPAGGQYGPAAPEVIRVWIAEGRITPDTLVWREGWRDWKEAREVFPSLGGAEFPQVAPEELPEMRFIRAAERPRRMQTLAIAVGILAALVLAGVTIWFFLQPSGSQ
ncbi:DUF4339 domain-containing protein [Thermogutta sp.]|jgi:hypothetical protein|uniref:DUF4339 domain-containing protein n=1 Tax=Thermogutta sp. TaxID=1962930 RepID=UPI00321FD639